MPLTEDKSKGGSGGKNRTKGFSFLPRLELTHWRGPRGCREWGWEKEWKKDGRRRAQGNQTHVLALASLPLTHSRQTSRPRNADLPFAFRALRNSSLQPKAPHPDPISVCLHHTCLVRQAREAGFECGVRGTISLPRRLGAAAASLGPSVCLSANGWKQNFCPICFQGCHADPKGRD